MQTAETTGKQEKTVGFVDLLAERGYVDLDFAHACADPVECGLRPSRRLQALILCKGGVTHHLAAARAVLASPERREAGNIVALRHCHIHGQHEFHAGLQAAQLAIDVFGERDPLRLLRIEQRARRHAQHDAVDRSLRAQFVELHKSLVPLLRRLAAFIRGSQFAVAVDQHAVAEIRPAQALGTELASAQRRRVSPCGRYRCNQAALAGTLLTQHEQPWLRVAPFAPRGKIIDSVEKTLDIGPQPRADTALAVGSAEGKDRGFAKAPHDQRRNHQSQQHAAAKDRCLQHIDLTEVDLVQTDHGQPVGGGLRAHSAAPTARRMGSINTSHIALEIAR